ncbi:MAG TPA: hypothetical protein DCY20_01570, partial [Firmicutes bacterium]|nr:hypothetical protein [Bacillota bacterium]
PMTTEHSTEFLYSKYYINLDSLAIYTNQNIAYGDIGGLNNQTIGYLKNDANHLKFISLLKDHDVHFTTVPINSYDELIENFSNKSVDNIIYSAYGEELDSNLIISQFHFAPVYIVTNPENSEFMDVINDFFESQNVQGSGFRQLYNKYFNVYQQLNDILLLVLFSLTCLIAYVLFKNLKKYCYNKRLRKKIAINIEKNQYLLHYQPLINPRNQKIVGFEALLRLKEGKQILSPYFFLSSIEQANMMYEITFWILKQITADYSYFTTLTPLGLSDFYISMNISFEELSNPLFISNLMTLVDNSLIEPEQLCFEIVERHKLKGNEAEKIIAQLRTMGFKVAIDDFGTEYSNFDILEKIEYDIIKVDKYFIDNLEHSFIKNGFINLLSTISQHKNKKIILEGVETVEQLQLINQMNSHNLYIQGYYYAKPLPITEIKYFLQKMNK